MISAVSVANGKIITTSLAANFNLFWLEEDWRESVVDFREDICCSNAFEFFSSAQLLSVRNRETERLLIYIKSKSC